MARGIKYLSPTHGILSDPVGTSRRIRQSGVDTLCNSVVQGLCLGTDQWPHVSWGRLCLCICWLPSVHRTCPAMINIVMATLNFLVSAPAAMECRCKRIECLSLQCPVVTQTGRPADPRVTALLEDPPVPAPTRQRCSQRCPSSLLCTEEIVDFRLHNAVSPGPCLLAL